MRRKEDLRSVIFVLGTLALEIGSIGLRAPWSTAPLLVPLICFLCLACWVINHNHQHAPVFESERANTLFRCLLSAARGQTSTTVFVAHNLNHHVHSGTPEDWSRPELAGHGRGVVRLLRYLVAATGSMRRHRREPGAPGLTPELRRSLPWERAALLIHPILLAADWRRWLVFVALPCLFGAFGLLAINLIQHDGCAVDSDWDHSRNFVSPLGNWLLFNNGYHTVHHRHPRAHWADLPALHEREAVHRVRPELECPSILRYVYSFLKAKA